MGVRETLRRKPAVGAGIGAVLVLIAAASIGYQARANREPAPLTGAFYTTDDGKTWFEGSLQESTPFEQGGKQAVQAHVFICNGKESVRYLSRHTPEVRAKIRAAKGKSPEELGAAFRAAYMGGTEVKRPGDARWVKKSDREYAAITTVTCESGPPAEAVVP